MQPEAIQFVFMHKPFAFSYAVFRGQLSTSSFIFVDVSKMTASQKQLIQQRQPPIRQSQRPAMQNRSHSIDLENAILAYCSHCIDTQNLAIFVPLWSFCT